MNMNTQGLLFRSIVAQNVVIDLSQGHKSKNFVLTKPWAKTNFSKGDTDKTKV